MIQDKGHLQMPELSDELPDHGVSNTATSERPVPLAPSSASPSAPVRVEIVFASGDGLQALVLEAGESRIVGRGANAELVVDERSLSRQHARFTCTADGVTVEDLGSKNGTWVDSRSITHAQLAFDADLFLGDVAVRVRLADPRGSDPSVRGVFESYERVQARLHDELRRARGFSRPLAVLLLRAARGDGGHLGRWCSQLRAELRPVDAIAVYGPNAILIVMPEVDLGEAAQLARILVRARPGRPDLRCGVAAFPASASSVEGLLDAARQALQRAQPSEALTAGTVAGRAATEPILRGPQMLALYRLTRRAAQGSAPLLIVGETGAGKELVARFAHEASPRRERPLCAINCAAIPASLVESTLFGHEKGAFTGASARAKGVFEEADGGSVFLDEIGELALPAQAALLRVLETKRLTRVGSSSELPVDVRVIAATHRDLEAMVAAGTFRSDLLHRLDVVTLRVPPLRERTDDLEPLAMHFLAEARGEWQCDARAISAEAWEALRAYAWPGNVRELRNAIERAAMTCEGPVLTLADLPERVLGRSRVEHAAASPKTPAASREPFAERVRTFEIDLIREALAHTGGNQKQAARHLDMPLRTLVYKIRAYGLRKDTGEG